MKIHSRLLITALVLSSCNNEPSGTPTIPENSDNPGYFDPNAPDNQSGGEANKNPIDSEYTFKYVSFSYGALGAASTFLSLDEDKKEGENTEEAEKKEEGTEEEYNEKKVEISKSNAIKLNLFDAGEDCLTLIFKLTQKENVVADKEVVFKSQVDYPTGAKMAFRSEKETTDTDPVSGRPFLTYKAKTSPKGLVSVPVCSGFQKGLISTTAVFTDDSGAQFEAKAPDIEVDGGIANYGFTSLTYDTENSRSIYASLLTNKELPTPFKLVVKSKDNSAAVATHKVQVAVETGFSVSLDNLGEPNEAGEIVFNLKSLGLTAGKPHVVHPEYVNDLQVNNPKWPVDCDPFFMDPAGAAIDYAKLAFNWRGTMLYHITGQEFFNDANSNGKFDENNGDGFWDKNQNGVWDGPQIDELTFDYNNNGQFDFVDANGAPLEWFIDIPSPFVDANENNTWDSFETIIGDSYTPPNGKWDKKTLIWKSITLPLYFGMSSFSLIKNQLSYNGLNRKITPNTAAYFKSVGLGSFLNANEDEILAIHRYGEPDMFNAFGRKLVGTDLVGTPDETSNIYFLYAKEVCGGPLPGGSTITVDFATVDEAKFGDRPFVGEFAIQPGDEGRPNSRRLFRDIAGDGFNKATLNFNIVEHPSSLAGYPFRFKIRLLECKNPIKGAINNVPGVICDAKKVKAQVRVSDRNDESLTLIRELSTPLSGVVLDLQNAHCATGATLNNDNCVCPINTQYNPATFACDAIVP